MKFYKLNSIGTKWEHIPEPNYNDTLKNWIKLYNEKAECIGIGIY